MLPVTNTRCPLKAKTLPKSEQERLRGKVRKEKNRKIGMKVSEANSGCQEIRSDVRIT